MQSASLSCLLRGSFSRCFNRRCEHAVSKCPADLHVLVVNDLAGLHDVCVITVSDGIPLWGCDDFQDLTVDDSCVFHFYHSTITKPGAPRPLLVPPPPPPGIPPETLVAEVPEPPAPPFLPLP